MIASRTSSLLAFALAASSLSACSYDCGTVSRTVASGTVRDGAGVILANASVDLTDNLRPTFLRVGVGVMGLASSAGAPLRGHVTHASLVTESGELLHEIPTGTETLYLDGVVALNVDVSKSQYDRVRNAILTNRAKVILDTDIPGREHIETTLSDAHDVPGTVSRCSPTV